MRKEAITIIYILLQITLLQCVHVVPMMTYVLFDGSIENKTDFVHSYACINKNYFDCIIFYSINSILSFAMTTCKTVAHTQRSGN